LFQTLPRDLAVSVEIPNQKRAPALALRNGRARH
jgi:hypothetical protein